MVGRGGRETKGGRGMIKKSAGKIGRSAISGKFVPVSKAKQHPRTTVVETIKKSKPPKRKK
jgi:hypothetical protein